MRLRIVAARLVAGAAIAGSLVAAPSAGAGDLVFTPINPSFGGNPLNSSHLLGMANAQRTATASDANNGGTGGGGTDPGTGTSDADLFVRQLQGRLLSALASQVTEAIFGENPQDQGTVTFGDTTVSFIRTADSIRLIITDPTGITEIVVPQLTGTTSSALAAASSQSSSISGGSLSDGPLSSDGL